MVIYDDMINAFVVKYDFCTLILYLYDHYKDKKISNARYRMDGVIEFKFGNTLDADSVDIRMFGDAPERDVIFIKTVDGYFLTESNMEIITQLSIQDIFRKFRKLFKIGDNLCLNFILEK